MKKRDEITDVELGKALYREIQNEHNHNQEAKKTDNTALLFTVVIVVVALIFIGLIVAGVR